MPEATAGPGVVGVAAGEGLDTVRGDAVDDCVDGVADCVVPELEPDPSDLGISDEFLQATAKTIVMMIIVTVNRFIKKTPAIDEYACRQPRLLINSR